MDFFFFPRYTSFWTEITGYLEVDFLHNFLLTGAPRGTGCALEMPAEESMSKAERNASIRPMHDFSLVLFILFSLNKVSSWRNYLAQLWNTGVQAVIQGDRPPLTKGGGGGVVWLWSRTDSPSSSSLSSIRKRCSLWRPRIISIVTFFSSFSVLHSTVRVGQ